MPHLAMQPSAGPASTLDLPGPGLTVVTGPGGGGWELPRNVATGRVPVTSPRVDAVAARALAITPRGALVVRPDGTPAALTAVSAPPGEVADAA